MSGNRQGVTPLTASGHPVSRVFASNKGLYSRLVFQYPAALSIAALIIALPVYAAEPVKLHPSYECTWVTADGVKRTLTLAMEADVDTIQFSWFSDSTLIWMGIGVRHGNHIAVLYGSDKTRSVTLYEIQDGRLVGWSPSNDGPARLETCLAGKPV